MGVHETEEGVVDVRADFAGAGGEGGGGVEAGVDDGGEGGGDGGGVGEEEAVGDLGEGFADLGALVGEGDGEVGFELGDEGGDGFRLEESEVAEGQEEADVLLKFRISTFAWIFSKRKGVLEGHTLLPRDASLFAVFATAMPPAEPLVAIKEADLSAFSTIPDRALYIDVTNELLTICTSLAAGGVITVAAPDLEAASEIYRIFCIPNSMTVSKDVK